MNPPQAAVELAEMGVMSFPLREDKSPSTPRGFKDASCDLGALARLWRLYPGQLIGVPTGPSSGIDVLDIDLTKHAQAEAWLEETRHLLPATRTHRTRSGGLHILFQSDPTVRCSAGKIAPGVDIRAGGGYVVWWPAKGLPVSTPELVAPWPDGLLAMLAPRRTLFRPVALLPRPSGNDARRYAMGALRRAVEHVAGSPPGQRNDRLNRQCFAMCRFIGGGTLSPSEVAFAMAHAGLACGLSPAETERTIASALGARAGK